MSSTRFVLLYALSQFLFAHAVLFKSAAELQIFQARVTGFGFPQVYAELEQVGFFPDKIVFHFRSPLPFPVVYYLRSPINYELATRTQRVYHKAERTKNLKAMTSGSRKLALISGVKILYMKRHYSSERIKLYANENSALRAFSFIAKFPEFRGVPRHVFGLPAYNEVLHYYMDLAKQPLVEALPVHEYPLAEKYAPSAPVWDSEKPPKYDDVMGR